MKTSKKNLIDGKKDIVGSTPIDDREVKLRITTWIDSDVLRLLKEEADQRKIGYQTILNQKLRKAMLGESDPLQVRVSQLEKTVERLKKKVS